jgi:hypothetical protein
VQVAQERLQRRIAAMGLDARLADELARHGADPLAAARRLADAVLPDAVLADAADGAQGAAAHARRDAGAALAAASKGDVR